MPKTTGAFEGRGETAVTRIQLPADEGCDNPLDSARLSPPEICMSKRLLNLACPLVLLAMIPAWPVDAEDAVHPGVRHSFLSVGGKTVIIGEDDVVQWEYLPGARDGFVLPDGNVLLAYSDRVEEVTRGKQVVFSYKLRPGNSEIATTQRLYNGNTLVTELGPHARLFEVNPRGEVVLEFPLQPETDNTHMMSPSARQLRNGNYLVSHLLAFAVKEYAPDGRVVSVLRTDLPGFGGRPAHNWPFTVIRLDNGNTLVSLTHGRRVVEFTPRGDIAWQVTNEDVGGRFNDVCGAQRLASGNTVAGNHHGVSSGVWLVEVNPARKIVWMSSHPLAAEPHHFQILTTNGRPEPGMPLR